MNQRTEQTLEDVRRSAKEMTMEELEAWLNFARTSLKSDIREEVIGILVEELDASRASVDAYRQALEPEPRGGEREPDKVVYTIAEPAKVMYELYTAKIVCELLGFEIEAKRGEEPGTVVLEVGYRSKDFSISTTEILRRLAELDVTPLCDRVEARLTSPLPLPHYLDGREY